jgi:hypothetical protein
MRSVPQERVLTGHGGDQLPKLPSQSRPASVLAGPPAPVDPPSVAVPAHNSLGTDQEEMSSPVAVKAPDQEPDDAIACLKPATGSNRKAI